MTNFTQNVFFLTANSLADTGTVAQIKKHNPKPRIATRPLKNSKLGLLGVFQAKIKDAFYVRAECKCKAINFHPTPLHSRLTDTSIADNMNTLIAAYNERLACEERRNDRLRKCGYNIDAILQLPSVVDSPAVWTTSMLFDHDYGQFVVYVRAVTPVLCRIDNEVRFERFTNVLIESTSLGKHWLRLASDDPAALGFILIRVASMVNNPNDFFISDFLNRVTTRV